MNTLSTYEHIEILFKKRRKKITKENHKPFNSNNKRVMTIKLTILPFGKISQNGILSQQYAAEILPLIFKSLQSNSQGFYI